MNLAALITGNHKPYRVFTVGILPVDQLPRFEPGIESPAFVQHGGWTVYPGTTLYVHRDGIQHELHGTTHVSTEASERAAYGAGLLGVMVYEHNAVRYGFPSAS